MAKSDIVRSKTLQCRVSDTEFDEIEKKADKIGLSVSSYLRMICLTADINVTVSISSDQSNIYENRCRFVTKFDQNIL